MSQTKILGALTRRWYVTVPGVLLSLGLAAYVYQSVQPSYQRTATELLIPPTTSVPDEGNPYLYIGGLSGITGVLTEAASAQSSLEPITRDAPGTTVEIVTATWTASPVISISVESPSDETATRVLADSMTMVEATLTKLQTEEHLPKSEWISMNRLTVDTSGTVVQKLRYEVTGVAAVAGIAAALGAAVALDGLLGVRARRRRLTAVTEASQEKRSHRNPPGGEPESEPTAAAAL